MAVTLKFSNNELVGLYLAFKVFNIKKASEILTNACQSHGRRWFSLNGVWVRARAGVELRPCRCVWAGLGRAGRVWLHLWGRRPSLGNRTGGNVTVVGRSTSCRPLGGAGGGEEWSLLVETAAAAKRVKLLRYELEKGAGLGAEPVLENPLWEGRWELEALSVEIQK